MAQRKIEIPVAITIQKDSLSKISSELDKIAKSTTGAFDKDVTNKANEIRSLITQLSAAYAKDSATGQMTPKKIKEYEKAMKSLLNESHKLSKGIKDNIKGFDKADLNTQDLKEFEDAVKKLAIAKKELEDLEKKPAVASLTTEQRKELETAGIKLGNAKSLTAINKKLIDDENKMLALQAREHDTVNPLNKNEENRLKILRDQSAKRAEYKTILDGLIVKEQEHTKSVKEQTDAIKDNNTVISAKMKQGITKKSKEQIGVSEGIDAAVTVGKDAGEVKTAGENVRTLGKDLNITGGLIEGARTKWGQFTAGIASGAIAFRLLNTVYRQTWRTIRDLDKAFNEIAMVTVYTTQQAWQMKEAFTQIATTTGLTITQVANLSIEFFRQGRALSEVLSLTEAAGAAAKVANISVQESARFLTSAINAYKLSADQAMTVSDKFSALAQNSASSYQELATALSKVAAQAYSAGVNLDNMMGFIAKALETTREAPENIGTAFKTIFARMSELKDFGKTLEDGTDVNRVDTALKAVGITLRDTSGEIRAADEVLIDLGNNWKNLSKNQKAYITTALAGTRQQTRLLAIMEDFDRTMELTEISANSLGSTFAQQSKYYNSIAYAINGLTVAWQNFITSLGSSSIIIGVVNIFKDFIESLNTVTTILKDGTGIINMTVVALIILSGVLIKTIVGGLLAASKAATISGTSFFGLGSAAKVAALAVGNLGKAVWMSLGPIGLVALAVGALVLTFNGLAETMKTQEQRNREFVDSMRKTQAEIFNLRKESTAFGKLADEYEELSKKVDLTNADLERQNQLVKQMQDLAGEDFTVMNLEGDVDLERVRQEIDKLNKEADDKFSDSIEATLKGYKNLSKAYSEITDSSIRDQILIQQMISTGAVASYSEFLGLEKEKRKQIIATARLQVAEIDKFYKKDANHNIITEELKTVVGTEYQTGRDIIETTLVPVVDEEALKIASDTLTKLYDANFIQASLLEKSNILNELQFEKLDNNIKSALTSSVPELQGMINLMDSLGETSIESFNKILDFLSDDDSPFNLTDKQLISVQKTLSNTNLSLEQQIILMRIIATEGTNAIGSVTDAMSYFEISTLDTLNILQDIQDSIDSVSNIDISNLTTGLNASMQDFDKFNKMIRGEEEWNLEFMLRLAEQYDTIADHITSNKELSAETIRQIANDEKEALILKIDNQIAELEAEMKNNSSKIVAYQAMIEAQNQMNFLASQYEEDLSKYTIDQMARAYNDFITDKGDAMMQANRQIYMDEMALIKETSGMSDAEYLDKIAKMKSGGSFKNWDRMTVDDRAVANQKAYTEAINNQIKVLNTRNDKIKDEIQVLKGLQAIIEKNGSTLAKSKANEKMQDLLDALTEIEKLLLRIGAIQGQLDILQASAANQEGEELVHNLNTQILLTQRLVTYQKQLIREYNTANKATLDTIKLSPAMAKAVKIIDGRLVTTEAFLKLGPKERESLMDSIETYNDYADSIDEAKSEVQNLIAAEQELIDQKRDMIDQTKQLVIEALREEMTARSDMAKKAYEEEKKWLDKRKEMYSDAFSEEDYANNLEEQNKKRQELIEQIAALEGATDLASVKKREELLNQKAELDKTYNTTVRDYNRQALLDSIDEEGKALDTAEEQREEAFKSAFDDMVTLEAEATQMIKNSIDSTVAYLQLHSESYRSATAEAKEKMLEEWRDYVAQTNEIMTGSATDTGTNNTSVGTGTGTNVAPDVGTTTTTTSGTWGVGDRVRAISAGNANSDGTGGKASSTSTGYVKRNYAGKPYPYLMTKSAGGTDYLGWYKKESLTKYKKGGLIDYTGPAWVDGSAASPERVLTSVQTDLFHRMITALEKKQGAGVGGEPIYIDSLNISTGQLNTNADFRSAGRELAKELKLALATGGIGVNTKK